MDTVHAFGWCNIPARDRHSDTIRRYHVYEEDDDEEQSTDRILLKELITLATPNLLLVCPASAAKDGLVQAQEMAVLTLPVDYEEPLADLPEFKWMSKSWKGDLREHRLMEANPRSSSSGLWAVLIERRVKMALTRENA